MKFLVRVFRTSEGAHASCAQPPVCMETRETEDEALAAIKADLTKIYTDTDEIKFIEIEIP